jgi:beta-lactamase class A
LEIPVKKINLTANRYLINTVHGKFLRVTIMTALINSFILVLAASLFLQSCDRGDQREGKPDQMKQNYSIQDLRVNLAAYLDQYDEFIAVALQLTAQDAYLGVQDSVSVHAASTMKVPVMLEVFRQAGEGRFVLDDSLLISNSFRSIIDGSFYSMDIKEDGGERLYALLGKKESIRSLVNEMITYSGNLATNLLIDLVKAENVQQLMLKLGAGDVKVLRGVEDIKAFEAGKNNTTTAKDLARLYQALYQREMWSEAHCREMLDILLDQKFTNKIPAGLPPTAKVAHKTGSITGIDHDSGIIFPENRPPYILVVLTKGFTEHEKAQRCIAGISGIVYQWYHAQSEAAQS